MTKHLDLHAIHTVPAANLNRDMSGMPKTVTLGGVTRARVSSQSWNYAMRAALTPELGRGVRTRDVVAAVEERHGGTRERLTELLGARGNKVLPFDSKTGLLKTVFFFTTGQLDALAHMTGEGVTASAVNERLTEILTADSTVNDDVALFGSTLLTLPGASVTGALSSMHSFSTHEAVLEFDEFTSCDDTGAVPAAHVGVHDFVSATFYRFSTINLTQLETLVGSERCAEIAAHMVEVFASVVPVARQSSFHAATRPDLLAVMLRDGKPEPYSSAFDQPVSSGEAGGFAVPSVNVFLDHHKVMCDVWGVPPVRAMFASTVDVSGRVPKRDVVSLPKMVADVRKRAACL